ncbi:MAG: acyl-ACP--UDP-N-acetylglucosamine O-acyltransferase [Chitinivibrionales bacterium]|nr:acyl-ACP--UDP-N-acetylglucosamine O-acyltransferase [Chitinivibrionales bacterium]
MSAKIHSTALIDPSALLGSEVSVGPYSVIEGNVQIGDGCTIGPHALIGSGTRLGKNCAVFHGAAVGGIPQDKKFSGEESLLIIGDNTTIREFVTLNRGTSALGKTVIGSDCWIMAYCHVAHDCILGNHVTISNGLGMGGHVVVGDYVTIGGMVAIHQFVHIGDYAIIGATSYLTMDVVPFALCGTGPVRVAGINKVGLERRGFDEERRQNIKRAYKILFRRELTLDVALQEIEHEFPGNPDCKKIIDFAKTSERGLLRM